MMQRNSIAIFLTLMLLISTLSIVSADEEDIPEDDVQIQGTSKLVIHDNLIASQSISATWSLNVTISEQIGTSSLDNPEIGIRSQIDINLGDSDGNLSISEIESFQHFIINDRNWTNSEIGGCCILDVNNFTALNLNVSVISPNPGSVSDNNGTWGWTEHSDLSGQTDSGSIRLLTIPRVGNIIEEVPLTIVLPEPFQFGFSPMLEIISGNSSEFTVNRSAAPVASDIRISIRENMPPTIVANRFNQGSQVSLNYPTTYEAQCFDSELENIETEWKVSNNGTEVLSYSNEPWISITPSELGFSHGEVLSVVFSCTDSLDETETWYENIVIDGISPTWEASFTSIPTEGNSREIDVSDGIIEIGSEEILEINITAFDDSGNVNTIEITSNKTSEWRHVDWDEMVAQSTFSQDNNVNGIHLDIESRHQGNEESRFSLNLSVTDDAGNPVYKNWTLLVIDQAGPQILPEIYSNGSMIELESFVGVNETLTVNLSNSFDDLDSISDTIWTIIIDEETIFDNQSFEQIENFDYTPQKAGNHWFQIIASDSKQNVDSLTFPISIQPSPLVDIHFWNISHYGSSIVGDSILFHGVFQNHGGNAALGRLCSQEVCSEYVNIPPATSQYPIVEFGVDLDLLIEKSGYIDLYFEWTGVESDQKGEISIDHEIYANPDSGPLQTTILVFAIIAGFSWLAHRLWGTERLEE